MLVHRHVLAIGAGALLLAGCIFDGGGVGDDGGDDTPPPDGENADDRDDDGVPDDFDNCPDDANPGQFDEDGDEIGNACDNCPHVANDDQANDGEDGAGDACDPSDAAGNDVLFFEGFDEDVLDEWGTFGGGDWMIEDGALHQSSTVSNHVLFWGGAQFTGAIVEARFNLDSRPDSAGESAFGTLLAFTASTGAGSGYYCVLHDHPATPGNTGTTALWVLAGTALPTIEDAEVMNANLAEGETYDLRQSLAANGAVSCAASSTALPGAFEASGNDGTYDGGLIGFRTIKAGVSIDYVIVYGASE